MGSKITRQGRHYKAYACPICGGLDTSEEAMLMHEARHIQASRKCSDGENRITDKCVVKGCHRFSTEGRVCWPHMMRGKR